MKLPTLTSSRNSSALPRFQASTKENRYQQGNATRPHGNISRGISIGLMRLRTYSVHSHQIHPLPTNTNRINLPGPFSTLPLLRPLRPLHPAPLTPCPPPTKHHTHHHLTTMPSPPPTDGIEAAKRQAAYRAVAENFDSRMSYVGIGSGSTIVYGVQAIREHLAAHPPPTGHINWFVPTGWNSRAVVEAAGLLPRTFDSLPADVVLDVCFDGADEVDAQFNCIKGGGACLFQEKLVACASRRFVCIADDRKDQPRLLTRWPAVPVEVAPVAHAAVARELRALGSPAPRLRQHPISKAGPLQTDQSFYIIDAPFPPLRTGDDDPGTDPGADGWTVDALARRIQEINGVLAVGLFWGEDGDEAHAAGRRGGQKPVAVYFGTEGGEVVVRRRRE